MSSIDLNCDLGEEMPGVNDEALMPWLSSCNIACGGHAGDDDSMARTVRSAVRHRVAIGAHPSYPDREDFGRRSLDLPSDDLVDSVLAQCRRLASIAETEGATLRHVKPHGALYNDAAGDPVRAGAVLDAVERLDPGLRVFGLPFSRLAEAAAERNLAFVREAFADRRYHALDRLLPRSEPGAVLSDPAEVLRQLSAVVEREEIETDFDGLQALRADTLCVHSDTPGAVDLLAAIHEFLSERHIAIRPPG